MKRIQVLLSIAFLGLFVTTAFAQESDNQLVKQVNVVLLSPGVSAEIPLSDKITVFGKLDLGLGFSLPDSIENEFTLGAAIIPAYTVQGRYYYKGLKSETRKEKPLFGNSGNYVFAQFAGDLRPVFKNNSFIDSGRVYGFGLGWGVQHVYKSRIIWSYGIGLGYESTQNFNLISEFTLGINLNKR